MRTFFRLAIRNEGKFVCAYAASMETMDGAILLGTILSGVAEKNPDLFAAWKKVMADAVARALEAITGEEPEQMPERPLGNA